MSYLPCENPNCKSYGRPHPNCRCHGDMAEGGEASFCSKARLHDAGCEFFADGGDTIDPASVVVDSAPASQVVVDGASDVQPAGGEIDPSTVVPDEIDPSTVVIDGEDPEKEQSWGDVAQKVGGSGYFQEPPVLDNHKLTDEELKQTGDEFENAAGIASLVTGSGVVGAATKAAEAAAKAAKLGKIGSGVLKGFIANGLIQGADETSKALLGQGDPHDAVNPYLATGAAALFGGMFGGAGAVASELATKAINDPLMKVAAKAESYLAGLGHAASGESLPKGAAEGFKKGFDAYREIPTRIVGNVGYVKGGRIGQDLAEKGYTTIANLAGKMGIKPGKYVVPTVARWLSEGAQGSVFNMIEYADKVAKGTSLINNSVENLFRTAGQKTISSVKPSDVEKLRSFIDDGGMNQSTQDEAQAQPEVEGYAEGGHVEAPKPKPSLHDAHAHIAQNMPDQNMILQTAKGRISNYLSAQRPQEHVSRLTFDDPPDDTEQKKTYDKALHVAVNPLGVMDHIHEGTVDPENLKHLHAMYPDLSEHLKKKLTEQITKSQVDGKKPSFAVRQGLSMMLGTPLSGDMTPQNIQAAQATFAPLKARTASPDPTGGAPKTSKSSALSKTDRSFLTDDQARERRQQRER